MFFEHIPASAPIRSRHYLKNQQVKNTDILASPLLFFRQRRRWTS